jgi:flagellin
MISFQTNVNSLVAEQNLNVNNAFQSKTIQQLTSGYRINSSADDAAGLSVANKYRSDETELTQGVMNANNGVSQLQIVDGGLTNISQMLDRLKTLATESASDTFTGDRNTLNTEYQTLLGEISRQAANVGLVSGGSTNQNLGVYIGGGANSTDSQVTVGLSGSANQVDAAGLGLANTNVAAAGTELAGNTVLLNNAAGNFSGTQNFTFYMQGQTSPVTVTYNGTGVAAGDSTTAISKLNGALSAAGLGTITASIGNDGTLQFSSGVGFSVTAGAGANGLATATSKADSNAGLYSFVHAGAPAVTDSSVADELDTITNAQGSVNLDFSSVNGASNSTAMAYLNSELNSIGVYAVANSAGTGFTLQSSSTFSIDETQTAVGASGPGGSVFGTSTGAIALTNSAPASSGAAAQSAITQIEAAVAQLGLVQGRVGAGENQLNYAIGLAQSQITNFSAAESQIRDADVATEAANLTKAQVLQQSAIAAMAQANTAPQAVLALLKS